MLETNETKGGPRKMLTIEQVLELVPVGRNTLMRMIERKEFPGGHYISPNKRVWYSDQIEAWQDALPEQSGRKKRRRKSDQGH